MINEQWAGFTNPQMKILLQKIGYDGNSFQTDEINNYLAANPSASAKLGKYSLIAKQMVADKGKTRKGFNPGGTPTNWQTDPNFNWHEINADEVLDVVIGNQEKSPEMIKKYDANQDGKVNATDFSIIQDKQKTTPNITQSNVTDPNFGGITNTPVNLMQEQPGQTLDPTTGQITTGVPQVNPTTVPQVAQADQKEQPPVATVDDTTTVLDQTKENLENVKAQEGQVTNTIDPAQLDSLQQTDLDAAQLDTAQKVQDAPTRTMQEGEVVSGSTVDQRRVGEAFGTGEAKAATVQDELADLMGDFEEGETPAWASGAMRNALAGMASRGLGASSLAGQAAIQAAMESALPIAMADASNKQQMALMKAEQRAKFLNMEFDQNFQTKVINASKVSEIANMNFTAEQQVALENAKMAQTVDLANLSNRQAKIMADAAALTQLDLTNLNNRQQAQVQNAKNFLQMDLANLSNAQQTEMFKAQAVQQALLSDQAAENATKQFNASSQNQSDQFFAKLNADISQFNSAQQNNMAQFNAGETNDLTKFNAEMQEQRAQFNASNGLIVAQANTQWRQFLSTTNTAAINAANMQDAKAATDMTQAQMDNYWQEKRDLMSFMWKSVEGEKNRLAEIYMSELSTDRAESYADSQAEGALWVTLAENIFGAKGPLKFLNPLEWFK